MKTALVTGGCGFVGSWIVRSLLTREVKVRVLALPDEATTNLDGADVEIVRGDVRSPEDCKAAVEGMEVVFHTAAIYKAWMPDPTLMYDVNIRGTFNMLEASRQAAVDRVIYTASMVSLGRPQKGQLGDEQTAFESWDIDFAYARSKYHSRELAEYFGDWDLDVRVVCPGVVLGPNDIGPTPSGQLIVQTIKGGPPVYTEGGASYVDVRDAAEAHVLAAEKGTAGERYLATAWNLTNLEYLQTVGRVAGIKRRYVKVPTGIAQRLVSAMEKQALKTGQTPPMTRNFLDYSLKPNFYSNAKAVRELGARFRPIEETIGDAIAYFRGRGMI